MTTVAHEWWGELRHGGMLVAPQFLDELIPDLPELDERGYDRLRSAWLSLDAAMFGAGQVDEARRAFAAELLEGFLGLGDWQKALAVVAEFKATAITGEPLRPSWVLPDPDGDRALLAVWFDESDTVGRGRGVRAQAKLVELLRATGIPLGLLTNGRQFRLVHAGPDYDAWAEWDAQTWFDEGEGRETLRGLAALLRAEDGEPHDRLKRLIATIRESRNRQGDLAQVLGEQVRQGIELLVREVDHKLDADGDLQAALWNGPGNGHRLSDDEALAAIYQAATRVVMRLVLVLYAEARDLLPANAEAYHNSYGVGSLYDTLARADREGRDALAETSAAWPRILSLFRLVYSGSGHADLPVRAYGGQLFRPGDAEAAEPVLRALAALEATRPSDAIVYRLLRLLKVGKVKVRAGRGARWVAGAVDFSDLRTEYVGIVYEGLLDYELRRADADDPVVLLNVGRQPTLPLSRLSALTADELKELFKTFKKDAASAAGSDDDGGNSEPDTTEDGEGSADANAESDLAAHEDGGTEEDARASVFAWARGAVEAVGMVRRPRAASPDMAAYGQKLDAGAEKLVASVIPPGRLYLVASGGLRKGSGSFYTRPALSVPLAQRTLEPLCYDRDGDRLVPKRPDEILALKVCEPAMGSGSFLVAALRYLTDALARSLHHHGLIRGDGQTGAVIALPFGTPAEANEFEELLPLPPEDDRFDERLRSVLARHVVERCLYGVDRNPLAVELAKLSLWVETLDRELPFEFLDHKLKVGNSLVGCWLHLVEDYPIKALDREDSAGQSSDGTKWLKETFKEAKAQLPDHIQALGGAATLLDDVRVHPADLVATLRARFAGLHDLPREQREDAYHELISSSDYQAARTAMDAWCALWFWPAGDGRVPMPREWGELSADAREGVAEIAARERFFHWELEFPDVFGGPNPGFDAVLGNPPWETAQAESLEFFSNFDPLYRTYGKQAALKVQQDLLADSKDLAVRWYEYETGFRALAHFIREAAASGDRSLASRSAPVAVRQPYRHQGTGKTFTYQLFVELAAYLSASNGRVGLLVPGTFGSALGAAELRRLVMDEARLEWYYGFRNTKGIFASVGSGLTFVAIVFEMGAKTTRVALAFNRTELDEWGDLRAGVVRVDGTVLRKFDPKYRAVIDLEDPTDLSLFEKLYATSETLGAYVESRGARYSQELNVTSDSQMFTPVAEIAERLAPHGTDLRDPRVQAQVRGAGFRPLKEGKSFWLHDPYALGRGRAASDGYVVAERAIEDRLPGVDTDALRLSTRNVGGLSNQRTLIPGLTSPGPHANSCPVVNGLVEADVLFLHGVLSSLVADYVIRMKVGTNLNWFLLGTIPVPSAASTVPMIQTLTHRLNCIGADFIRPADSPLVLARDRLAARLVLDALVADLYGLGREDIAHIATRFPIYDRQAGAHRYTELVVQVYEAFLANGSDGATRRADELALAREAAGVGFGLDELWTPPGGWDAANEEAREILAAAGVVQ